MPDNAQKISNTEIAKLRSDIDQIDGQLLKLLGQRAELAQRIGKIKGGGVIYCPEREASIINRMIQQNKSELSPQAISAIYRQIMASCRLLEGDMKIAFLGPLGTFSEEAVEKCFCTFESIPCASIEAVFRSVLSGESRYGVVPVENSSDGAVTITLDLLVTTPLKICGEILLPVHLCLLSRESELSQIKQVYAHQLALGQCRTWLAQHLPTVELCPVFSNAEAARLASITPMSAAIASLRVGNILSLLVLASDIEDDPQNTTRFLILGCQNVSPSGRDKTSLLVATSNKPGSLLTALTPFANAGISITKLESRPAKTGVWEYIFFVDIEGHRDEQTLSATLAIIKNQVGFLKVLGSYPKFEF